MSSAAPADTSQKLLEPVDRILAIRFARLGDIALLLPAMLQLRALYPDAHLALMTGSPYAALARMCPQVDEVIAVDRLTMRDGPRMRAIRDVIGLVSTIRARRYDLVVDFHSFRETNLLARFSGARFRLGLKRSDRAYLSFCFNLEPVVEDKSLHVSEMFRRVVGGLPGSVHWFPERAGPLISVPAGVAEDVRYRHVQESVRTPLVAVYAGASVESRRWAPDRFAAIADHAASEWNATVLILTGVSGGEEDIGRQIVESVANPDRVRLLRGLEMTELAAAIGLSRLLVSNDSGPMHLGPLLGIPTMGIFSESLPEHYHPIGDGNRYIKKDTIDNVTAEEVVAVMDEMWSRGAKSPDRRS